MGQSLAKTVPDVSQPSEHNAKINETVRNKKDREGPTTTVRVAQQSVRNPKLAERAKHRRLHQVEEFLQCIYGTFNMHESVKLLLTSAMAKDALIHFLEGEKADSIVYLYDYLTRITNLKRKPNDGDLINHFNYVLSLYIIPTASSYIPFDESLRQQCMQVTQLITPDYPLATAPFVPSTPFITPLQSSKKVSLNLKSLHRPNKQAIMPFTLVESESVSDLSQSNQNAPLSTVQTNNQIESTLSAAPVKSQLKLSLDYLTNSVKHRSKYSSGPSTNSSKSPSCISVDELKEVKSLKDLMNLNISSKSVSKKDRNISISGDCSISTRIHDLFELIITSCLDILANNYFEKFLGSKQYTMWRTNEYSHAVAATVEDTTSAIANKKEIEKTGVDLGSPMPATARRGLSRRLSDFSMRAFLAMETEELSNILVIGNWITSFLSAAEALPVGITLATASSDRRGFPLLFVNKAFERMTGFKRTSIIGKNCSFLQCEETSPLTISDISLALCCRRPITRILLNKTIDGVIFKNLLSLKPIFDENNNYCYVIGLCVNLDEYDIKDDDHVSSASGVEEFMRKLPTSIMINYEE